MIPTIDYERMVGQSKHGLLEQLERSFVDAELRNPDARQQWTAHMIESVGTGGALADLIGEIRSALDRTGAVRVTNTPIPAPHAFLAGISFLLGEPIEPINLSWAKFVRTLEGGEGVRDAAGVALTERLHTDGTSWPKPNDLTLLLCIESDKKNGGSSRILAKDAALATLERVANSRAALYQIWNAPLTWTIEPHLGGGHVKDVAFGDGPLRWLPHAVETSGDPDLLKALATIECGLHETGLSESVFLTPGDLLILDNRSTLHARTALAADSRRKMMRIKVDMAKTTTF